MMKTAADDVPFADSDLAKLQRQFRVTEGDRKTYSEASQLTLKKQQEQLAKLITDNEFLTKELSLAEAAANDFSADEKEAIRLNQQLRHHEEEIESEQLRLKEANDEFRRLDRQIQQKRKQLGGASGIEENKVKLQSQIRTLENRVEKTLKKYNQTLTENAKLREKIDHLKQERKVFDTLHRKLEKELNSQKKQIAEVMEQSRMAYEARDEAQHKTTLLQEKAAKEAQQHEVETKELSRELEHDRKLKAFMGIKAAPRTNDELSMTQRQRTGGADTTEQAVHAYEQAFAKIKESTGIEDTRQLVDRFIQMEDQNFSLFNFVNELNSEIENLQEQISEIGQSIRRFNQDGEAQDKSRKAAIKELEDRLKISTEAATTYEQKHSETADKLGTLKQGIENIFRSPVCQGAVLTEVLGTSTITEANVMSFLGAIEQRTNELLQLRALLDQKEKEKWEQQEAQLRDELDDDADFDPTATLGPKPEPGSLLGEGPMAPVPTFDIVPPSTLDDLDLTDDEDLQRPLSHQEMKRKIVQGLTKRDNSFVNE